MYSKLEIKAAKIKKQIGSLLFDRLRQIRTMGYCNERVANRLNKLQREFITLTDYRVVVEDGNTICKREFNNEPIVNIKYVVFCANERKAQDVVISKFKEAGEDSGFDMRGLK
tara:strand:+ start:569 stop:907 length:339 start_codon:yes stop_codon:yes gene_type:complete